MNVGILTLASPTAIEISIADTKVVTKNIALRASLIMLLA